MNKRGVRPEPQQKLSAGKASICPDCIHNKVCRGTANQPCIECSQFKDTDIVIVRCRSDCTRMVYDPGSRYEPQSEYCGVLGQRFDEIKISPEVGESDEGDYPDCPLYINQKEIEELFWGYHEGEKLVPVPMLEG